MDYLLLQLDSFLEVVDLGSRFRYYVQQHPTEISAMPYFQGCREH
jgi:hypothetical protein